MYRLKNGKRFLRIQEPEKAFSEFKMALRLAQNIEDPIEEKKAARGVGSSLQRQGKFRDAIKYHSMVLEISQMEGEESGNTEAYGAIADCYAELGDLEQAAKYYDQYISRLRNACYKSNDLEKLFGVGNTVESVAGGESGNLCYGLGP
ncbi:hypothetical protein OROGR_029441 [Orobanche gracilis]